MTYITHDGLPPHRRLTCHRGRKLGPLRLCNRWYPCCVLPPSLSRKGLPPPHGRSCRNCRSDFLPLIDRVTPCLYECRGFRAMRGFPVLANPSHIDPPPHRRLGHSSRRDLHPALLCGNDLPRLILRRYSRCNLDQPPFNRLPVALRRPRSRGHDPAPFRRGRNRSRGRHHDFSGYIPRRINPELRRYLARPPPNPGSLSNTRRRQTAENE